MSDLRSELRADKNGKIVTRHVKTSETVAAQSLSTVQPTLSLSSESQTKAYSVIIKHIGSNPLLLPYAQIIAPALQSPDYGQTVRDEYQNFIVDFRQMRITEDAALAFANLCKYTMLVKNHGSDLELLDRAVRCTSVYYEEPRLIDISDTAIDKRIVQGLETACHYEFIEQAVCFQSEEYTGDQQQDLMNWLFSQSDNGTLLLHRAAMDVVETSECFDLDDEAPNINYGALIECLTEGSTKSGLPPKTIMDMIQERSAQNRSGITNETIEAVRRIVDTIATNEVNHRLIDGVL